MLKPTARGVLLLSLFLLPWLALLGLGLVWLWQEGWMPVWLGLAAASALAGWLGARYFQQAGQARLLAGKPDVQPNENWLARDQAVWAEVESLAEALQPADYPLDKTLPHKLLDLGIQVAETVARAYRPDSSAPALDIPLPYVFKTAELVCRDLRRLSDYVPFSHALTVNHFLHAPKLFKLAGQMYDTYRAGMWLLNPLNSVINELKAYFNGQLARYPKEELLRWFLQNYVRETGRYAIDLYSGALVLDAPVAEATPDIPADAPLAPLRVLVLGQAKSGKSSLINALFGELKAWPDALPLTRGITPYLLERDGLPRAVIFDSAGYAGHDTGAQAQVEKEWLACDVIILVSAAVNAARQPDHALLAALRAAFSAHPELAPPPVLCALSQIDRLPPLREWQPPYDIARPSRPKAQHIRAAMQTVAEELELALSAIVPVCLREGMLYNVEEGLIPALLAALPEARKTAYIRALRGTQRAEYWDTLRQQAVNLGTVILAAGSRARDKWRGG